MEWNIVKCSDCQRRVPVIWTVVELGRRLCLKCRKRMSSGPRRSQ